VLKGLGATVAIPVLPSLLGSTRAEAQASTGRFFVNLGTHHGAAWDDNFYPASPPSGVETRTYAAREIRRYRLAGVAQGGDVSVSPVLTASATRLTPGLLEKMWVLRGLDVPWYLGHHTGGHLGNFARNDANGGDGAAAQMAAVRRTIDQVMAWSPAFYPDLTQVRERALVLSTRTSYQFTNPSAGTGDIQEVAPTATTPRALFNRLFPSTGGMARAPIVDRVLENYRRLRASPRLSSADKARLDEHIQRVDELQRRINTMVRCTEPTPPASPYATASMGAVVYNAPFAQNPAEQTAWLRVMNDLIVAAFACGQSRIATMLVDPHLSTYAGDWHQDIAHQANLQTGTAQDTLWRSYRVFFRDVLVDLAAKLDAVTLPSGETLLDRSLIAWTQESGPRTHDPQGLAVVGFGGAGGALTTGWLIDYRNRLLRFQPQNEPPPHTWPGLLWHQWLGTVLQVMGVPKSEWENAAVNGGYPDYNFANVQWAAITTAQAYPQAVWNVAGERLPWFAAA
jgi:hypothetical protein